MCGICGVVNTGSNEPVPVDTIRAMCSVMTHRGPDEEGLYLSEDKNAALGIRRLSIIDLETGSQPISNEEKNIRVVCNGEIYNFRELRENLKKKGHHFKTKTDSEVIVHLYEEYGPGLLGHLRGAFAFALLDGKENRLFLARDRAGKRPLSYTVSNGKFIFASEIKSILKHPGIRREVNKRAIHDFLTYQYVPYPQTAFKGIYKIPPAHYLELGDGDIEIKKYWQADFSKRLILPEAEYKVRIKELFEEAVKLRLVSDVPLGAFLSGGLDSSIVVGVMSKLMKSPVKTFSIGFEEQEFSELKFARIIAEKFKTEHKEYIVRPDVKNILPKLVWHYDEPYSDSSAVPSYYLAKMASREVKVALNGDGGDENFAGYPRHKAVRLYEYFDLLPGSLKKIISKNSINIPEKNQYFRKARSFAETLGYSLPGRHARYICIFDNYRKKDLYSDEFRKLTEDINSYEFLADLHSIANGFDYLDRIMAADILSYLPGDLLVKMDIACMANSLEGRSPFLDHKFMEFAARIPSGLKLKGFNAKYILKKAYSDIIPPQILRRHKMGFGVPIAKWLRTDLREMFLDNVFSKKALERGYFNREYLNKITSEHMEKKADHGYRLWALLMLELWHREFIDNG